jgi:protein SCO1/2
VALFFTHCEFACPILVNDLQRIEAALPAEARERVDFLLVSIDPTRDTPKRLREFRAEKSLGLQHWTLLTGAEDDVRELAALLGVNYQRDARGQYAHSNLITVLGPDGEVVSQLKGLNQSIDELVRQIVTTHSQP